MGRVLPIIIVLSLILCGCGGNKQQTAAVPGYTCEAVIEYEKDFSAVAQIKVLGGGIFEAEIVSPTQLSGLKFSADRENITVSLKGVETPCQPKESYGGFADIMAAAFLKLSAGSPTLTKQKELVYEGTTKGVFFKFVLNEEGLPLSLNVPEKKLKVEFSKWQYQGKN